MLKRETEKRWNTNKRMEIILKLAISASLSSLGIVLSTVVVFVPNVEFVSVTIFLISILFGVYYGLLAAVSISVVYEFIITAIIGTAGLLVFFKLICYVSLAIIAGMGRKTFLKLSSWELGVFGSFFAIFYDLLTTIGYQVIVIQINITLNYLLIVLVSGAVFTIIHVIGNFVLFSLTRTIVNWIIVAFQARGIKLIMLPSIQNKPTETNKPISEGGNV